MMNKKYQDPSLQPSQRAQALLEELTLSEKVAQLNCIFPFHPYVYDFEQMEQSMPYGIGQVSTLEMRRMETVEEVAAWQRKIQTMAMEHSPHHIPAIFHMEGLCGAFIQDSTSFPSGIGRGSSFDPALEEKLAQVVSRQEAACGITHIFAPVLDISRDSRMGRQGETYGEDPTLAAAMGAAYTRGIQTTKTAGRQPEAVAKHFLAFHNSQGGIHGTNSDTPTRLLQEIYGKPFQAAIAKSGLRGIMPCYCSINGETVSASYNLLTALLRQDMGFDGLVVSDYGSVGNVHQVHHMGETLEDAGLMCLTAGVDMELPNASGYGEAFEKLFAEGKADPAVLDQAVLRILTAKFRMGLFEHPFSLKGEELHQAMNQPEDEKLSLQSARESLVLLKNDGTLPVNKSVPKIAVIGPHAAYARKFFGGYTHMCMMESTFALANSIAGVAGTPVENPEEIKTIPGTNIQLDETEELERVLKVQKPNCKSLVEELRDRLPDTQVIYAYGYPIAGADESHYQEALQAVEDADVVILTLGGKHGTCSLASMGEGVDSTNINLPVCQDNFMKLAAHYGKPMIGVHFDGRPISSDVADEKLNAIIEAWNPSEMGATAVVDVLLGDYNPSGKLPVSVARNAGQIPIYYNHPYGSAWNQSGSIGFANYVDESHTPRYYFGHGMSYTSFTYSNLQIDKLQVNPYDTININLDITNTGNVEGTEVAQLYIQDIYASLTRPVKELAGFVRVFLKPQETRTITFTVSPSQMAFLDMEMKWKIEQGQFHVQIGSSSQDIRMETTYHVTQDAWLLSKDREFYAQTEIM